VLSFGSRASASHFAFSAGKARAESGSPTGRPVAASTTQQIIDLVVSDEQQATVRCQWFDRRGFQNRVRRGHLAGQGEKRRAASKERGGRQRDLDVDLAAAAGTGRSVLDGCRAAASLEQMEKSVAAAAVVTKMPAFVCAVVSWVVCFLLIAVAVVRPKVPFTMRFFRFFTASLLLVVVLVSRPAPVGARASAPEDDAAITLSRTRAANVDVVLVRAALRGVRVSVTLARGGPGSAERFSRMMKSARATAGLTGTFFGRTTNGPSATSWSAGASRTSAGAGRRCAFPDGRVRAP
jgi:hypothetical protein